MMIGASRPAGKSPILLVIAGLFAATMLAFLNVNIGGQSVSLTALPLAFIALWPRNVHPILTIILVLIFGIFLDWGSGGAPGQWALVFLAVFGILRPDRRGGTLSLILAIRNWLIAALIAFIILCVTGWFVYGIWPNLNVLARQFGLITLLFPFLYLFRQLIYRFTTDPDDRYI